MFEISEASKQFPTKAGWLPLAKENFVNRIKHPDGSSVSYSCDELGQTIHKHEVGKMKSPCDLEILSDWVKYFHKLCKELGGISFIMEGGVFGKMTLSFYRPQRSCGQGNVFTVVCDSVHRGGVCLSACWDTTTPRVDPPGADTPRSRPSRSRPSRSRHPPQEQTPPRSRHPPPRSRHTPGSRHLPRSMAPAYGQ